MTYSILSGRYLNEIKGKGGSKRNKMEQLKSTTKT